MKQRKIVSVSRRSDIPAFYTPWFKNRVAEGFCHVINPYNQKVYRVSLLPEDVLGIVFWTRNPLPLLKHLDLFTSLGLSYCFHFTITGYEKPLETSTPPFHSSITMFKKLSEKVTPSRIFWRYDPIILSSMTPPDFHVKNFSTIASQLSTHTEVVIVSFIDFYRKCRHNLHTLKNSHDLSLADVDESLKVKLTTQLESIALSHNIKLETCCEHDLESAGFKRSSCINPGLFHNAVCSTERIPRRPTRKGCGCFESVDIGTYSTCLGGCSYCYATVSQTGALKNYSKSDQDDTILIRPEKYRNIDLDTFLPHSF